MIYAIYEEDVIETVVPAKMFDEWETDTQFRVLGVWLEKPERHSYEAIGLDCNVGDTVYVLSVHWDSGDSFGRSYNNGEVLMAFKDREEAKAARAAIETDRDSFSKTLKVEGKDVKIHDPTVGYFEDLRGVSVTSFIVEEGGF